MTRAGHWLLAAGVAAFLFPWWAVGLPVEVAAAGLALLAAGSFLLEHNWGGGEYGAEPILDEPRALTDEDVRVPYVPPERLWSKP